MFVWILFITSMRNGQKTLLCFFESTWKTSVICFHWKWLIPLKIFLSGYDSIQWVGPTEGEPHHSEALRRLCWCMFLESPAGSPWIWKQIGSVKFSSYVFIKKYSRFYLIWVQTCLHPKQMQPRSRLLVSALLNNFDCLHATCWINKWPVWYTASCASFLILRHPLLSVLTCCVSCDSWPGVQQPEQPSVRALQPAQ